MQARNLVTAALGLALSANAVAVNWPGAVPCNGTLQACINGVANGTVIDIVTDGPIDESLNLYNRSITLQAGAGFKPVFAPTNWITATTSSISGDQTVNLSGLTLDDGYVLIAYNGTGTGRYDVRGMTVTGSGAGLAFISVAATNGSTVEATVQNNTVRGRPNTTNDALIKFASTGSTLNARALYNRVTANSASAVVGSGILATADAGASGVTRLHANEVRGSFTDGGIAAEEGVASTTASSYAARAFNNVVVCSPTATPTGVGLRYMVDDGTLAALAINNTTTRCSIGISVRPLDGTTPSTAQITGTIRNNLVVAASTMVFSPVHTTDLTNSYNFVQGDLGGFTAGPNTLTGNPQLVDLAAPRLRESSPAINVGETAALLGMILNAVPAVDADGLRRLKTVDGGDDVDIGAYEYGDRWFRHTATAANISSHTSTFDDPVSNDSADANLVVTANFGGSAAGVGVANDNAFGVYWASSRWRVFNENTGTPMTNGAKFNVFAPAPDAGSFRHVSAAANISGRFTEIDSGSTNGVPNYIVLATQNWSAGSGIYNPHPIGIDYNTASGRWRIANLDAAGTTMPANAGFNVYAQPESPNAFRVTSSGGSQSIVLDHPLLNGVPCAQVNTTRVWSGSAVGGNHDVYYDTNGRWRIFAYGTMPTGTTFHVVIDPRQVFECTDRIFANGFQ
jgi:hypothetical protein